MSENVRVIVRSRPMNKNETNQKKIVKISDLCVKLENPQDTTTPPKSFTFDSVYDDSAPTEAIYNDICYPLVESVLEGFNATIFAYGQTGCGKSFTMSNPTPPDGILKSAQRGIISRAFEHVFEAISVARDSRYLALVSYLEIYNENIKDLLSNNRGNLPLKETAEGGIMVQNLSQHPVQNVEDCEKLLALGNNSRAVGGTNMNATSSRSHSIFSICIEQVSKEGGGGGGGDDDELDLLKLGPSIKRGKLNLVDLAGSERQAKTGATGERLKEATKINLSLSALGNVISALVDGKTKHIPYRDSKLTRLLQDSLGGNTKTLMIACISPAETNYDETLSTLRYANRAKNISNKPTLNEDPTETIMRQYREEILKLKELLLSQSSGTGTPGEAPVNNNNNNQLDTGEHERLKLEMQRLADEQRREKDNLMREMQDLKNFYENKLNVVNVVDKEKSVVVEKKAEEPIAPPIPPVAVVKAQEVKLNKEEIYQRIKDMKGALIGGERASDLQLMEKRRRKKLEADLKQQVLREALDRIAVDEEREQLQGHYADIQQELTIKTEALKARRQKIRAQEREILDIQSEFQLERADYLESIRKAEQSAKFYRQLLDKALPILRRDNRFWDVDDVRSRSEWNDDTNSWLLPEDALRRVALPMMDNLGSGGGGGDGFSARLQTHSLPQSPKVVEEEDSGSGGENGKNRPDFLIRKLQSADNQTIVDSYFRPKRAKELLMRHSNSSGGGGGVAGGHPSNRPKMMMFNKLMDKGPDVYPTHAGITGRTILPTNHVNYADYATKLKNI